MRTKSKIRCEWSNNVLSIWQKCTANTRNTSKYGNSQHNRKALHSAQRTTQRPSRGHNKVMNLAGVQCFVTITQPLVSSVFNLTFFLCCLKMFPLSFVQLLFGCVYLNHMCSQKRFSWFTLCLVVLQCNELSGSLCFSTLYWNGVWHTCSTRGLNGLLIISNSLLAYFSIP